jgi:anti-sigma factor ChrR (cupin superfamily)
MSDRNPADKIARDVRRILDHHRKCPPSDTLVAFHDTELDPADGTAVAAHLGNCTDCARLIERLENALGRWLEALRKEGFTAAQRSG